jgi:MFS family permease
MGIEAVEPTRRYQRKLLALLSVATFFDGYDSFVLALVLPLILGDLGGSETQAGLVRGTSAWGRFWGSSWRRRQTGSGGGGCC